MRRFLPGKDGFPWLAGVAGFAIVIALGVSSWRSSSNAPALSATVTAATPAPVAPTVTVVKPEIYTTLSARLEPITQATIAASLGNPEPPAAQAAVAAPAPVTPAAARCAKYNYLINRPKRESILDDMESKYQEAFEAQRRQSISYHQCMRQVAPAKGG